MAENAHRDCSGCIEYRHLEPRGGISRRRFVGWSAGLAVAAAVPAWLPRAVLAESHNGDRDVLVSLFLRGGADALSLCPPYLEPAYHRLRPTLALAPPDAGGTSAALDLDGTFGLAPALAPLLPAYDAGDLLVVHACGQPAGTRSHFAAMNLMEVGTQTPAGDLITGWLGRHLAATAASDQDAVLRAVALGTGLPRTLVGGPRTLPVPDPAAFDLGGDPATAGARREAIERMYAGTGDALETSAAATIRTIDLLAAIDFPSYRPAGGAVYPESELGQALRAAAALIRAEVGVEALAIDAGGWDTHDFQGPADGAMAGRMADLGAGLAAFHADLDAAGGSGEKVTLVAMSEFGRNAFENASFGTDHGHGGLMLALGRPVNGGQVISRWPGLEPEQLYQGQDLDVTIDYRDVLAEIVRKRLDNENLAAVFPDPAYTPFEHGVVV